MARLWNSSFRETSSPRCLVVLLIASSATVIGCRFSTSKVPLPVQYTVVDLGTFDSAKIQAQAINNSSHVVGWASAPERQFLFDGTIQDLCTHLGGGGRALAINDYGQLVGWVDTQGRGQHAFIWDGRSMRDLGTLGGRDSRAFGINECGDVVGGAQAFDGGPFRPFLYDGATLFDLGTLGGELGTAHAINEAGVVVGESLNADGDYHAFLYDGTIRDLGTLGGRESYAYDISDSGIVVGASLIRDGDKERHGFLYDGTLHDIGTLGGKWCTPRAINEMGQIVGFSETTSGDGHAFLYQNGRMHDLNDRLPVDSQWVLVHAYDINDKGQIVGDGVHDGRPAAFLLTPRSTAEH